MSCEYDYDYGLAEEYDEKYNYTTVEIDNIRYSESEDGTEVSALTPSTSYSSEYSLSVSSHDLEETAKYEIQWRIHSEVKPKTVAAKFDRKIYNYDPRFIEGFDDIEDAEFDLVFQQLTTGNIFTIHSDLIDTGAVEFFPLADSAVF